MIFFEVIFLLSFLDHSSAGSKVSWPSGKYGLPMPTSGCPHSSFSWRKGWRFQDTENDNPSNGRSQRLHIEGSVEPSSVNQSFCIKEDTSSDAGIAWPEGKYCIYNKGGCQGLKSGFVTWTDESTGNTNKLSGVLPDGVYKNSKTTYKYCCRTDGIKSTPITLPIERPFYLFAYGSAECQEVKGAVSSSEWIHYDTENTQNTDRKFGSYPFGAEGRADGHTIYLCYYSSCNHLMNATSGVIKSPNFPNPYPYGQLCTWKIKGLPGYTIHLQFTNFSLDSTSDVLEVYDGANDNATLLGGYRGNVLPSNIKSSNNALYMVFRAGSASKGKGFSVLYNTLNDNSYTSTSIPVTTTSPTTESYSSTTTQTNHSTVLPTTAKPSTTPNIQTTKPREPTTNEHTEHTQQTSTKHSSTNRPTENIITEVKTTTQPSKPTKPKPTEPTAGKTSKEPEWSCVKSTKSSINVATIAVPIACAIFCFCIAVVLVHQWRKTRKRTKEMRVLYQANTSAKPSYYSTKIVENIHSESEERISSPSNQGSKDGIYQEIKEEQKDNPLYETGEDKEKQNPLYLPAVDYPYHSIPVKNNYEELSTVEL